MDALHNNVFRNARSGTRDLVVRFDSKANGTGTLRQFVSKATRPKLPGGLLLSPGLPCAVSQEAVRRRSKTSRQVGSPLGEPSVEIKTQQERITRGRRSGPALHGLLNLLFYELLDSLRCLKATAVAFIKSRR
jgi:hypothetical protein